MRKIAIITARGGSKRIPGKNIRDFFGKPIISYSITAALNSGIFDEVMVSTDKLEIADIAKKYGAAVPFLRSEYTSGDFATTAEVLSEVLDNYRQKGEFFDLLCCLYPTAPFVTEKKLCDAVKILQNSDAYSLIPVVRYSYPPQRAMVIQEDLLHYQSPEYEKSRSQDLQPLYHDCGQFYICKIKAFDQYQSLITPKTIPYIISEKEVQDIDSYLDWDLAEVKYKMLTQGEL